MRRLAQHACLEAILRGLALLSAGGEHAEKRNHEGSNHSEFHPISFKVPSFLKGIEVLEKIAAWEKQSDKKGWNDSGRS